MSDYALSCFKLLLAILLIPVGVVFDERIYF